MSNRAAGFVRALRAGRRSSAIRCASLFALMAAAIAALSPTPSRSGCIDYDKTIHVRGGAGSDLGEGFIAVSGTYAYATDWESGFQVYDIADPDNPRLLADLDTTTRMWDVAAQGSYAYATAWDGAYFSVFDARVPNDPRLVGQVLMPGATYGVAVAGRYAYVGCPGQGLQVVDVGDPAHPRIVGSAAGTACGVAIQGHFAYTAEFGSGLAVYDVSDPLHPQQVGALATSASSWVVTVSGRFAYVGDSAEYGSPDGFHVIDISDVTAPRLVATIPEIGTIYSIAIAGNRACLTCADLGALAVVDITDPATPSIVDLLSFPYYFPVGVATFMTQSSRESTIILSGGISYDPLGSSGWIHTIDVDGSAHPAPVASLNIPCCATDLALGGDYACVTVGSPGLEVIDIADPLHPSIAGAVNTPDFAVAVEVQGKLAYVGDYRAGLQIVSIADPHAPVILGSVDTPGYTNAVAVSGDFAYIADGIPGLHVIDVSDPTNPRIVATLDTPDESFDVVVSGTHAFVADGASGLLIIDIADPLHPQIVGSIDTPEHAFSVGVWEDRAYFTTGWPDKALRVVDVGDPTNPHVVGRTSLMGSAGCIVATRNYVYLSNAFLGLQVVDVSDPTRPRSVGHVNSEDHVAGVAVSGPRVFIADGDG